MFGKKRKPKRKYTRSYKPKRKPSVFLKFFKLIISVLSISSLILLIVVIIGRLSSVDFTIINDRLSNIFTNIDISKDKDENLVIENEVESDYVPKDLDNRDILLQICIISDIHQDENNLLKASEKIKISGCDYLFVIGDLTNYGDVESLKKVRDILNEIGVSYYAIPGDHDLAQSVSVENFNTVFGINYHLMEDGGIGFLLIDNSPNYTTITKLQMSMIEGNIGNVDFIILSQPLYVEGLPTPFNNIFMGSMLSAPGTEDLKKKQSIVRERGEDLLDLIRESGDVRAVFAGEHHRSSKLKDSVREDLTHYVVGAITSTVNEFPQEAIQTSRFTILNIFEDGEYLVEEIILD